MTLLFSNNVIKETFHECTWKEDVKNKTISERCTRLLAPSVLVPLIFKSDNPTTHGPLRCIFFFHTTGHFGNKLGWHLRKNIFCALLTVKMHYTLSY